MYRLVFFTLGLALCLGCSGEDGIDGPQGPQGEQGLPGPIGETGVGTVIYSDWFPTQFPDPLAEGTSQFSVKAPSLSQDIIDQGIVLVFAKELNLDGTFSLRQFPFSFTQDPLIREYNYSTSAVESLTIMVTRVEGTLSFRAFDEYRYVLIPGGSPTSGKAMIADFKEMSYKEIAAHFGILD